MNDKMNDKIIDWLKKTHGADMVEQTQDGYHCITGLFEYTIQERTVVALMEHSRLSYLTNVNVPTETGAVI